MTLPCKRQEFASGDTVCTMCGYTWITGEGAPRCPYATRQDDLGVRTGSFVFVAAILGLAFAFGLFICWIA